MIYITGLCNNSNVNDTFSILKIIRKPKRHYREISYHQCHESAVNYIIIYLVTIGKVPLNCRDKAFSYSPNSADVFFFKKSNNFFTEQSSYSINFFTNFIFKIASWPFFWQNCTDDPLMIR